ncbi:hypothetical protein GW17_00005068 [Ensete ventricosum]|nr:hypothetical protein GW17_00005068 [Ensete ventricosum]RZS05729.1 hypothetical protein BHM03_00036285 [Ensete ventricosum]
MAYVPREQHVRVPNYAETLTRILWGVGGVFSDKPALPRTQPDPKPDGRQRTAKTLENYRKNYDVGTEGTKGRTPVRHVCGRIAGVRDQQQPGLLLPYPITAAVITKTHKQQLQTIIRDD